MRCRCGNKDIDGAGLTDDSGEPAIPKTQRQGLQPPAPAKGPGTELARLIKELRLRKDCSGCAFNAGQMNTWGVQGCRDNFDTIVGWLRESEETLGWVEKIKAAAMAVTSGLAFKINWDDPIPDLINEAIRRAEGC